MSYFHVSFQYLSALAFQLRGHNWLMLICIFLAHIEGTVCRTVLIGSDIYFNQNNVIRTLQISWHPYSDTHIGILSSDSVFRYHKSQNPFIILLNVISLVMSNKFNRNTRNFAKWGIWDFINEGFEFHTLSYNEIHFVFYTLTDWLIFFSYHALARGH